MTCEIRIPEEWPPELALAVATLVRQSFDKGFPIIVPVRKDASPGQIWAVFERIRMVVEDAGLAV
jgi:hypothetical protein